MNLYYIRTYSTVVPFPFGFFRFLFVINLLLKNVSGCVFFRMDNFWERILKKRVQKKLENSTNQTIILTKVYSFQQAINITSPVVNDAVAEEITHTSLSGCVFLVWTTFGKEY